MVNNVKSAPSLTFTRSKVTPGVPTTHVQYSMTMLTSIGELEATRSVPYRTFIAEGAEKMDGKMYFKLAEELHHQEMNRILEEAMTWEFGSEELFVAA